MRGRLLGSLCAALGLLGAAAHADEIRWRPVPERPPAVAEPPAPAVAAPAAVIATTRPPAATLGRPVGLLPTVSASPFRDTQVTPTGYVARGQAPDGGPPPVPPPGVPAVPPGPGDPFSVGVIADPNPRCDPLLGRQQRHLLNGTGPCSSHSFLQSDHAFDGFISPVTNPFEFEDPRSLTEVRPIFILQTIPSKNPVYRGGDAEFFGLQGRVALTERWSIVLHKLGGVAIQPGSASALDDEVGFSEIELGPKWTFLRSESTCTLGALGLAFDIPLGSGSVGQSTGSLTLRPYLSMGQSFGRSSYGSFNALGTIGYNFGVDNSRTDNFFTSLHLDFNVANANKIYPLLELNWRHYTANGKAQPAYDFEGADLANFGSGNVSGNDILTIAPGVRYKFTECAQIGTAVEFPITQRKDLYDFRWTIDLIFRY